MRRLTIVILLVFLCLWCLCSCSTASIKYEAQGQIGMNYNNINNYSGFWLTNESICYLGDSLVQEYFLVDKNTKTKIDVNSGYGSGKIQRYGNKVYLLEESTVIDEYNSDFELKVYDVDLKAKEKICSIKNCDNFLILDESIYYLEYNWVDDVRKTTLKQCLIGSGENTTVENAVLSFGVIENDLFYVTEEEGSIVIFKYNDETAASVKCGEILSEAVRTKNFRDHLKVSYTSNNVLFSWVDYENETSTVLKYSLKNNTSSDISVTGYIDGFVSYQSNSYIITSSEQSNKSKLYKLNNETNEITEITEFQGAGSLFVGSDEGAYVLEHDDNALKYYSNRGDSRVIYRF